ncbi:unnamed protein product [Pleuronectes platessa]|uniref:Uncharacterized protein n=1 Tax=Pleuronectes platessa TaxID=8262 RepID=A0A9N7TLU3_PLEPL|nr:unnamed protein product [Pleuronectes platessa]
MNLGQEGSRLSGPQQSSSSSRLRTGSGTYTHTQPGPGCTSTPLGGLHWVNSGTTGRDLNWVTGWNPADLQWGSSSGPFLYLTEPLGGSGNTPLLILLLQRCQFPDDS